MKVSEQIIEVLNYLGEKFGIAIDWTSENVIPYITTLCQKLISYEIWTSVAWMAIMAVLSVVWFIITRVYREPIRESWDDADFPGIAAVVVSMCLGVATICVIGTQIFDIIKCTTFPEMYVFEYIQGIINTAK